MSEMESLSSNSFAQNAGKRRRLALVIHSLYGGGAERLMSQLATRWATLGHEVHLITLAQVSTDQYKVEPTVTRHGLDLMRPSRGSIDGVLANRQRVVAVRGILRRLCPDYVLSFCDRMNIVTATATRKMSVPVWIAEHSDPDRQRLGKFWETWRSWAYRGLGRRPGGGCVVLNESIAVWMRSRYGRLTVRVIPPAVEVPEYVVRIEGVNGGAAVGVNGGAAGGEASRVVLTLGRHSAEKNLSAMLEAWSLVVAEFPEWRLVMAGDGPEHIGLKEQARRLGMERSVEFPGWVSDPWPWLERSGILVQPSRYEGFPVTMLEAMSCGLACVSTPAFGDAKSFAEQGALELCATGSAHDIAASLRNLMGSAVHRQDLAAAGRRLSLKYRWSRIGPLWDQLLA